MAVSLYSPNNVPKKHKQSHRYQMHKEKNTYICMLLLYTN